MMVDCWFHCQSLDPPTVSVDSQPCSCFCCCCFGALWLPLLRHRKIDGLVVAGCRQLGEAVDGLYDSSKEAVA
jgi:hypothetical protein